MHIQNYGPELGACEIKYIGKKVMEVVGISFE
jgi:hypothetical protein